MRLIMIPACLFMFSFSARADFNLAHNEKKVVCYGEDNQAWVLNASRTTVEYTVEGESAGPEGISSIATDGHTYVSYQTSQGLLVLGNDGDKYQFQGSSNWEGVRCK